MALASIIVPCFNQLEFTRHCLRALFRYTCLRGLPAGSLPAGSACGVRRI